jgi:hypothetical protein
VSAAPQAPAKPLADGSGAIFIALIYGVAGPLVGAALVGPVIGLVNGEVGPAASPGNLMFVVMAVVLFPFTYYAAGAVALATGIVVAAVAHRRGRVPLWVALVSAAGVFAIFATLNRVSDEPIPGAAALQGDWKVGIPLWLAVCVGSSAVCWCLTLPIQKRLR